MARTWANVRQADGSYQVELVPLRTFRSPEADSFARVERKLDQAIAVCDFVRATNDAEAKNPGSVKWEDSVQ